MNLLVHPESVFLIVYPGGYCGEFIAWWLGLHPGCIRTGLVGMNNNRYLGRHAHNYVYHEDGSRDRLYLTAHPSTTVSKIGFDVPDKNQHIILHASTRTHRFYFLLQLIKTVFARHKAEHQSQEFQQYLNGRTEFIGAELDSWLKKEPCPSTAEIIAKAWAGSTVWNQILRSAGARVNIDSLFFDNYATGYEQLCQRLNLLPDHTLNHYILEYHQRNVELVEYYTGMELDTFLDLDHDTAMTVMVQASDKSLESSVNKVQSIVRIFLEGI